MLCPKCGAKLTEVTAFCQWCGESTPANITQPTGVTPGATTPSAVNPDTVPPLVQPLSTPPPPIPRFVCPFCQFQGPPRISTKMSTGGWIVFAALLLVCFPLCWIPLRRERLQRGSPDMRRVRHQARLMSTDGWRKYIRLCAMVCFAAYLARNVRWLAVGKVPPSVLRAYLDIPCPTTGGMRSFRSLLHGDFYGSVLWNPFTIPILILSALSCQKLMVAALRKKELLLPDWLGAAWCSVLITSWLAKFLLGRAYW